MVGHCTYVCGQGESIGPVALMHLYGTYGVNSIPCICMVLKTMYGYNFYCELADILFLSTVEKKSWASHWYQEQGHRCRDSRYRDDPVFDCVWLMPSLNWGQISNSRNSTVVLGPPVSKYDSQESQAYQAHSASVVAVWISKVFHLFGLF